MTTPDPTDEQIAAFKAAWRLADDEGRHGERVRDGLRAAAAAGLRITPQPDDDTRRDAQSIVWALREVPTAVGPGTRARAAHLLAHAYLTETGPPDTPNPQKTGPDEPRHTKTGAHDQENDT